MPSAKYVINAKIEEYLLPLIRGGRKETTIRDYRKSLQRQLYYLADNGYKYSPTRIGREEVEFMIATHWVDSPKYNHNRRSLFKSYLEYFGNDIMKEYPEPIGSSIRINVHWLEDYEAVALYNQEMPPIIKMIIHLELKMGLRRYDLLNLKLGDIGPFTINVLGKGNKYRTVPYMGDTGQVLATYMAYRDELTGWDRDPLRPFLLIKRGNSIKCPGKTFVDKYVKIMCKRAGIERPVCNHTLRRTCGRLWWRSKSEIGTISTLLGHSDQQTTMKYLGISLDDLQNGANKFDIYFETISKNLNNTSSKNA